MKAKNIDNNMTNAKQTFITDRDVMVIKMLSVVCHASKAQLNNYIGNTRIYSLIASGILERSERAAYISDQDRYEFAFRLTEKAKKLARSEFKIRAFYSSPSATHDVGMCNQYLSLSETEKGRIRNEGQTRNDFNAWCKADPFERDEYKKAYKRKQISCTDFTYISDAGELICIETATDNYKDSDIAAKTKFAEAIGGKLKLIKIKSWRR